MGVVDLKYKLNNTLNLTEFKAVYNFVKSYFCFENFTKLGMSKTIFENNKLINLEDHFYTCRLEKRYEQLFSNYERYNSIWNHYEDEKIIVDFYYSAISSNSLSFTFVDKEKRIKEEAVLDFNKDFVKLFKSFEAKLLVGEWSDLADLFSDKALPLT